MNLRITHHGEKRWKDKVHFCTYCHDPVTSARITVDEYGRASCLDCSMSYPHGFCDFCGDVMAPPRPRYDYLGIWPGTKDVELTWMCEGCEAEEIDVEDILRRLDVLTSETD